MSGSLQVAYFTTNYNQRLMKQRILTAALLTAPLSISAQHIGAGYYSSMAVCNDGVPRTWGSNAYGQLGDSTTNYQPSAVEVYGSLDVVDIASGYGHTIALAADSTVWCWGRNDYGGLGDGTTTNSLIPVHVIGLDDVIAISSGDFFSAALKSDNTVWTWGHNNYGQLGNENTTNSTVPVQAALTNITAIAAGNGYLLVLRSDSTVWGWGLNDNDQLGAGPSAPATSTTALEAIGLNRVVAISAGQYSFASALKADGTVWTWGYNQWGQLGNGTNTSSDTPVPVPGLSGIGSLARTGGQGHTLAVRSTDGTVWAWGYNLGGQLGNGTNIDSNVPVQVNNLTNVVEVTCGHGHSAAIQADGTMWTWGTGTSGQLGNGGFLDSTVPVAVTGVCASTASVAEVQNSRGLLVYPNPTDGEFQLRLSGTSTARSGAVHTAFGTKVLDLNAGQLNGARIVDLSGQAAGLYMLIIGDGNGSTAQRIILR
jgi:YD repeat-containing protein